MYFALKIIIDALKINFSIENTIQKRKQQPVTVPDSKKD